VAGADALHLPRIGAWFHSGKGIGVWINVGTTRVFRNKYEAVMGLSDLSASQFVRLLTNAVTVPLVEKVPVCSTENLCETILADGGARVGYEELLSHFLPSSVRCYNASLWSGLTDECSRAFETLVMYAAFGEGPFGPANWREDPRYALPQATDIRALVYQANRMAISNLFDDMIVEAAAAQGLDSVQLTASPSFDGGWAYEIAWIGWAQPVRAHTRTHTPVPVPMRGTRAQYSGDARTLSATHDSATFREGLGGVLSVRDPCDPSKVSQASTCSFNASDFPLEVDSTPVSTCTYCNQVPASKADCAQPCVTVVDAPEQLQCNCGVNPTPP